MLEFQGFMDQITPSAEDISAVYKATPAEIVGVVDGLLREMSFNHVTFYVKWYTNGWKSGLPFLVNHPDNLNVRSDNRAFREVIDALHARGLSVGAMFQVYTYDADGWGPDKWGEWDVRSVTGVPFVAAMADATSPVYRGRLWAMMAEYIRLFPETDYVFIEGEGQGAARIRTALGSWLAERASPSLDNLTYRDEDLAYCQRLGIAPDITWSQEGISFAVAYSRANLAVAEDALRSHGFQGQIGLVYHAYNVESRYMDRALLRPDWWLLPWHYFGWDSGRPEYAARLNACVDHLLEMKRRGRKVCYLGDATIGRAALEPIRELYQLTREHLDGYLCMGVPNVPLGLRWKGVTPEMVEQVRALYREELFVKGPPA